MVLSLCNREGLEQVFPAWQAKQPASLGSCRNIAAGVRAGARRDAAPIGRIDQQKPHAAHRGARNHLSARSDALMVGFECPRAE